MNIFGVAACRIYQQTLRFFSKALPFRDPALFEGNGSVSNVPDILSKYRRFHPLIVTDKGIKSLNLDASLIKVLDESKVPYTMYSDVVPNPPFSVVEEAYELYKSENCDCLIAIGGGSTLDTAKAVGARVVNPRKDLAKMKGILKVRKKLPLMIAIPTTAGTGSEATAACVVVNEKTYDKFSINDPVLIPHFAILDDSLLAGLPGKIISTTGMDALTHAIESYIGTAPSKKIRTTALEACALIKNNLVDFYKDPSNRIARANMQKAAYLAGVSFTRGYVGYVHALAHALGGKYGVPHGLANAILLPYVLEAYGKKAHKALGQIADYLGFTTKNQKDVIKAHILIDWIKSLNKQMDIPEKLLNVLKDEDVLELSRHAAREANPLYPVPMEMDASELEVILLLGCK